MALSYALHHIEENGLAKLTNYGEYLEKFPPAHEAEIYREHGMELRPRRRPLEGELRLQLRRSRRLESGVARAAARSAGHAARRSCAEVRRAHRTSMSRMRGRRATTMFTSMLDRSPEVREAFLARHRKRELIARPNRWKSGSCSNCSGTRC